MMATCMVLFIKGERLFRKCFSSCLCKAVFHGCFLEAASQQTEGSQGGVLQIKYSMKKVFLKFLAKFAGKYLCQSLFFNKVAGLSLQPCLKRGSGKDVFSVNFVKF